MFELSFISANTTKVKVGELRDAIESMHRCAASVKGCKREEVPNELKVLVRSCNRLITLTSARMSAHDKERKLSAIEYCQKVINAKIKYTK